MKKNLIEMVENKSVTDSSKGQLQLVEVNKPLVSLATYTMVHLKVT